ncbi:hypothetical protein PG993_013450 [Apiospora rasikravindrae]|uniref:Uncharacterized protein n=1 Tax=Apiospora rasikravindrae TaxID=990691 RepID=A0ABR1RXS2_9PEZI
MPMQPQPQPRQHYGTPPYPGWAETQHQPGYYQAPGPPYGQILRNGALQQTYAQPPGVVASSPPQKLLFTVQGKNYTITDPGRSRTLFTVIRVARSRSWLSSTNPPHMSIRRGDATGPELAAVHYHSFTTAKMDVTLHLGEACSSKTQRYKKDFDSATGLGRLRWQNESSSFFSCSSRGGGLKLEASAGEYSGTTIAKFEGSNEGSKTKGDGCLTLLARRSLNMMQLEEIVATCVFERERRRRETEKTETAVAANEVGVAAVGVAVGS